MQRKSKRKWFGYMGTILLGKKWEFATKFLHLLLAIFVTIEFLGSLHPDVSSGITYSNLTKGFAPILHIWLGTIILVLCVCHWLWSMVSIDRSNVGYLLPLDINDFKLIKTRVFGFFIRNAPSQPITSESKIFSKGLLLTLVTILGISGAFCLLYISELYMGMFPTFLIVTHKFAAYSTGVLLSIHVMRMFLLFLEGKDYVLDIFKFGK